MQNGKERLNFNYACYKSKKEINTSCIAYTPSFFQVNGPGSYNSRGESSNSRLTPDIPPLLQVPLINLNQSLI